MNLPVKRSTFRGLIVSDHIPLEDDEQIAFISWCEDRGLKLTAIPNNTYTKYKSVLARNTRLGLRAGFPDLVVLISPAQSQDGEGYFLCIEMKRTKLSKTSDEQKAWLAAINELGCLNVQSYVCKGADAAERIVRGYLKPELDRVQL